MAATISDLLTNFFTTPTTVNKINLDHARKRSKTAKFMIDISVDAAGHIYRLARVRAHDVPIGLKIVHDGSATTGVDDMNFGVRTPAVDASTDPAQISATADECLACAVDLSTARLTPTDVLGVDGDAGSVADFSTGLGKAFWELAGIAAASEPVQGTEYELVMLSVGDPAGSDEQVAVELEYLAGD